MAGQPGLDPLVRGALAAGIEYDAADEARGLFERPGGGPDVIAEDAILGYLESEGVKLNVFYDRTSLIEA